MPFEFWACAAVGGAILVQPAVFSAEYAAHNETRLAVLALGAFVCALAIALREAERDGVRFRPQASAALIGVLAMGSFHHLNIIVGQGSATQTIALQVATALALAAMVPRLPSMTLHRVSPVKPPGGRNRSSSSNVGAV